MVSNQRENSYGVRAGNNLRGVHQRGSVRRSLPLRISSGGPDPVRRLNYAVGRQALRMKQFFSRDRVRMWAANNAYTLCFLAVMFVITWAFIFWKGV